MATMMGKKQEQAKVLQILYDHFKGQYRDEKKTIAAINYIGQKVQEPGCKLVHFGEVVFMVTVSGSHMVEVHAMIGGNLPEKQKLAELTKDMPKLIDYLRRVEVKLMYTYVPKDKESMFADILRGYDFKSASVTGPNDQPCTAFYVTI